MSDIIDVTLERCNRPPKDELASLEMPFRPFAETNGWYAHFFYHSDGAPAYKRLTHGDHAELWYKVAAAE